METNCTPSAWLTTATDEKPLRLEGTTTLGRSSRVNCHAFAHAKISTRHAIIHAQEGGEFWLADRGSTNGTLLNGETFLGSRRLHDGDEIKLGHGVLLTFHQPVPPEALRSASLLARTEQHTHEERRWLLIADLVGFTALGRTVPAADLARTVGKWLTSAADLLTTHGGRINKYTGDGFLAFWREHEAATAAVAAALQAFRTLAAPAGMSFRLVLHIGTVAVGGAPSLGEESLLSDDLSFTFRMEKVAATLDEPILLSLAAATALGGQLSLHRMPFDGEIKGFPGPHSFYTPIKGRD